MTLPIPIDPANLRGQGVTMTVVTRTTETRADEALHDAVAWIGEVRINGVPVYGARYLAHVNTPPDLAERSAGEAGLAGFAHALRNLLGYDPSTGTTRRP